MSVLSGVVTDFVCSVPAVVFSFVLAVCEMRTRDPFAVTVYKSGWLEGCMEGWGRGMFVGVAALSRMICDVPESLKSSKVESCTEWLSKLGGML